MSDTLIKITCMSCQHRVTTTHRRDDHSNTQADTPQHAQAAAAPADDSIPF